MRRGFPFAVAVAIAGCLHPIPPPPVTGTPDASILGEFEDDYGNRYTITMREWFQHPRARYHVLAWHTQQHFLVARNDSGNVADGGRWTRVDWMQLSGTPPYTWGFCLSAYAAPSAAAAESVHVAQRASPRTGCNGFPFSRMRRVGQSRN